MRYQKQVSDIVWRKNKKLITFKLNTAIFPYLIQESLISERAEEKYTDPKCFEYQKIDLLVSAVPLRGHDDYLVKFIKCLRSSADDAGNAHCELADHLERELSEMLTSRISVTEEIVESTIYDPRKSIDENATFGFYYNYTFLACSLCNHSYITVLL